MLEPEIKIYSAISGGKTKPLDVNPKFNTAIYKLFLDTRHKPKGWDAIEPLHPFTDGSKPNRRIAKAAKILPWFYLGDDWEYAIWMDGTHMCLEDPERIVDLYCGFAPITTFDHGRKVKNGEDHNCIYKEAALVNQIGFLEDKDIVDKQMMYYKRQGFPEDFGLCNTSVIIWHNCYHARLLALTWWEQICKFSGRDQLSLFYAHWKCGTKHNYLPGYWMDNPIINRVQGHAKVNL